MVKAEELANFLGDEESVCCAGWIGVCKLRESEL
jgi:hypothetical protein